MENRKQAVRLLMRKERDRREQLRREAAAAAAAATDARHRREQLSRTCDSSVFPVEKGSSKTLFEGETPPCSPSELCQTAPAAAPLTAATPAAAAPAAAAGACMRDGRKPIQSEELPPDFFDADVYSDAGAGLADLPAQDKAAVTSEAAAAGAGVADYPEARAPLQVEEAPVPPADISKAEKEKVAAADPGVTHEKGEVEKEEDEEGVVFEIEEPDASWLLPINASSSSDGAGVCAAESEGIERGESTAEICLEKTTSGGTLPIASLSFQTLTAAAKAYFGGGAAATGRETARAGSAEGAALAEPQKQSNVSASLPVVAVKLPPVCPSPVTAALIASATSDELHWYRPFDTISHSELLHEEEELEKLQREAQAAAEKRAAAAREAASTAAAAAVAALADTALEGSRRDAGGGAVSTTAGLTRQQLANRKAAAEAAAAAAAAAEAAAEAAAAAAEKRAAATAALLGKKRPVKAARIAQQQEIAAGKGDVPWGFFDDEEREAAARGLTGPKRLQELLQQAEERRREVAEDLQKRKEDWLQHRDDVWRFVHGVEEQLLDTSAYRMRVERLKQIRKAAVEGGSDVHVAAAHAEAVGVRLAANGTAVMAVGEEATSSQESEQPARGSPLAAVKKQTAEVPANSPAARSESAGPDAAKIKGNQVSTRRVKVEKEEFSGSTIDGSTRMRCDSDSDVRMNVTVAKCSPVEAERNTDLPSGENRAIQKHSQQEILISQLAAAAVAKKPALPAQKAELRKNVQTGTRVHEAGSSESDTEKDDEDFSGEEDDDSGWRAKSLLIHSGVTDT